MPDDPLYIGLDLGTSGARAVVIDGKAAIRAEARSVLADWGANHRDPSVWWAAAKDSLTKALAEVDRRNLRTLCVDGTSGTLLPVDATGQPLAEGSMYNDLCADHDLLRRIDRAAPLSSAARGATSGLARAIEFSRDHRPAKVLHQADWIAGQFSSRWVSDENNALKTGYDPVAGAWPDWLEAAGIDRALLPEVVAPGEVTGGIQKDQAAAFDLPADVRIVAGTTDGCASFLATGATEPGEGVTALGSTMTIKLLSDRPVFSPDYGIYSHRILDMWLAGGASNTGGNVLLAFFKAEALADLSALIDPATDSGLDYYPLARPGERFPIADPELPPRLSPRPAKDEDFLKGILEGMANIEALSYRRLAELGAPQLASVRTVGGGAGNPAWRQLRARWLRVPLLPAGSTEAAYGAALLAKRGGAAA
jgi:xylulokinase